MKVVKINKGKAIPWTFRFLGTLIILIGCLGTLRLQPEFLAIISTVILSIGAPAIWFASNIISIDPIEKTIHDGVWTLGRKFGKPEKYNEIEKIYINKVRTKQTSYSLANNQHIITNAEYKAFLKTDNGDKYFLFSHPLEERANEKVAEVRKKIGI